MADVAVIPNVEKPSCPVPEAEPVVSEAEKVPETQDEKVPEEESAKEINVDSQKKALDEFKALVQEALNTRQFFPPSEEEQKEKIPAAGASAEVAGADEKSSLPPAETTAASETTAAEKPTVVSAPAAVSAEVAGADKKSPLPSAETRASETTTEEKPVVVSAVDDDGAKTVEAIEETVVAVSSGSAEQTQSQSESAPRAQVSEEEEFPDEVSIWGVPLLEDERSDAVLLKFLQARDFRPKEALAMLKKTLLWRKEFGIDALIEENVENLGLEKFAYVDGVGKLGNPVCYNRFGVFGDKEMYRDTFADGEKREVFLRWILRFQEKSIRKMLDFGPGGVCTFVQVNDFKNSPFLLKRELRIATDEALQLLQDNYPEFVAKQVFINVPWWYVAFQTMINPFLTQRTKSKFVFVGPSKSTETLFKYIAPEQVPVEYGGFSKAGEQEFTTADSVTEETIKPSTQHTIELPFSGACNSLWEVRVSGWDVSYGAEFVPSAEDGFTVIVQKTRKINQSEETVISGSFKVTGPGKIVLTFDNQTTKKKKLLFRSKTKPSDC